MNLTIGAVRALGCHVPDSVPDHAVINDFEFETPVLRGEKLHLDVRVTLDLPLNEIKMKFMIDKEKS